MRAVGPTPQVVNEGSSSFELGDVGTPRRIVSLVPSLTEALFALGLGARVVGDAVALEVVNAFLEARFSGEARHQKRLDQVRDLERNLVDLLPNKLMCQMNPLQR